MQLFLGILLWSVHLCSQSSISCANGDQRSQIKIGNLYNPCHQAQAEDVPRVDPLPVKFTYTLRGQGIITNNCGWSGEEVGGRINSPPPPKKKLNSPFWTMSSSHIAFQHSWQKGGYLYILLLFGSGMREIHYSELNNRKIYYRIWGWVPINIEYQ